MEFVGPELKQKENEKIHKYMDMIEITPYAQTHTLSLSLSPLSLYLSSLSLSLYIYIVYGHKA